MSYMNERLRVLLSLWTHQQESWLYARAQEGLIDWNSGTLWKETPISHQTATRLVYVFVWTGRLQRNIRPAKICCMSSNIRPVPPVAQMIPKPKVKLFLWLRLWEWWLRLPHTDSSIREIPWVPPSSFKFDKFPIHPYTLCWASGESALHSDRNSWLIITSVLLEVKRCEGGCITGSVVGVWYWPVFPSNPFPKRPWPRTCYNG